MPRCGIFILPSSIISIFSLSNSALYLAFSVLTTIPNSFNCAIVSSVSVSGKKLSLVVVLSFINSRTLSLLLPACSNSISDAFLKSASNVSFCFLRSLFFSTKPARFSDVVFTI